MYLRYILLVFNFFLIWPSASSEIDTSDWIDPHDMSPAITDYEPSGDIHLPKTFKYNPEPCDNRETKTASYFKRIINMILNLVIHDPTKTSFKTHLVFEISAEDYQLLSDYANDKNHDLNAVDAVLSDILKKPHRDYLREYLMSWFEKFSILVTSRTGIAVVCSLCYVYVVYKMVLGRFSMWYITKFLLINFLLFDFMFIWIRLYKEEEINRYVGTLKYTKVPNCNIENMSTMEILWNAIGGKARDECKEFYHMTLSDIFWTVSPGDVVVEMFTRYTSKPLETMGPAIGSFVYGIFHSMPWGVNIILLPFVLIFIMSMSCITLSFILNKSVKFTLFPYVSFSFGDHPAGGPANRNVLTGKTVDRLLNIADRNQRYIENERANGHTKNEGESILEGGDNSSNKINRVPSQKMLTDKTLDDNTNLQHKEGYEEKVIDRKEGYESNAEEKKEETIRKRKRDGAGDM